MNNRIGAVIAIAMIVAAVGAMLAMQGGALGQQEKSRPADEQAVKQQLQRTDAAAKPQRWEYQVLSLSENDETANSDLARLVDDGWEYMGVIPPAASSNHVVYARVLFKRVK